MSGMVDLSFLPGIDRWGARRIEQTVRLDTAGGALIGVLLTPPLLFVARLFASTLRHHNGYPWGLVGFLLGWFVAGYLALLALANWRDLETEDDEGSDR